MSVLEKISGHSFDAERPESPCNDVLIAEDDALFRQILRSWLVNWGYRVTVAETGSKAWEILEREDSPQLLILDWIMPEIDGLELCRRIRERNRAPYQYILLATARDDRRDRVSGLDAGADDYLTKPFDRSELKARLRSGKRILMLQEDLIRAREDLRFQATHDVLTGLLNRAAILQTMRRELERTSRSFKEIGVLLLDLDHFKRINDTQGHVAGDTVLRTVAERIAGVLRPYDSTGRYGGEEFLVVLPGCGCLETQIAADRIRAAVACSPIGCGSSQIDVTVSIGAVTWSPGRASEKELLLAADAALYQAKEAGRDRVVM